MTIHLFGRSAAFRGRNLFDLLARSPERDPSLAVSAYYAGDRRGPRVSFTVPGGGVRTVAAEARRLSER